MVPARFAVWKEWRFLWSVVASLLFLLISFVLNYVAGIYAIERANHAVTDLLLDHLPLINVDLLFVQGSAALWLIVAGLLLTQPKYLPFVVKSVALFTAIRAGFITLTHLGPYSPEAAFDAGRFFQYFSAGGDYFFSGHTGAPFLLALMFWQQPRWRWFFLVTSGVFAVSVLLGHLHYSIDVFSAFFITYGIFHMARWLFPADYARFTG